MAKPVNWILIPQEDSSKRFADCKRFAKVGDVLRTWEEQDVVLDKIEEPKTVPTFGGHDGGRVHLRFADGSVKVLAPSRARLMFKKEKPPKVM